MACPNCGCWHLGLELCGKDTLQGMLVRARVMGRRPNPVELQPASAPSPAETLAQGHGTQAVRDRAQRVRAGQDLPVRGEQARSVNQAGKPRFDKVAYQRDLMRRRRAAAREGKGG
jgi:hypothetical protein